MSATWPDASSDFSWRCASSGSAVELTATPESILEHAELIARQPIRTLTIEQAKTSALAAVSMVAPFRRLRRLKVDALGVSGSRWWPSCSPDFGRLDFAR